MNIGTWQHVYTQEIKLFEHVHMYIVYDAHVLQALSTVYPMKSGTEKEPREEEPREEESFLHTISLPISISRN